MLMDHLIYAHPDLDTAVDEIERRFGVRASGGGQHRGQGTHNKLISLGPRTYLELIAPDPAQPEPARPRPYGTEGNTAGGLVGWAVACDDIEAAVAEARRHGFDPGDVIDGRRVDPTGSTLRWRLTNNALTAGPIPFLLDWGDTPHPARSAPQGLVLESFHIEHPDPSSIGPMLAALGADVDVRPAPGIALVARINGPGGSDELR